MKPPQKRNTSGLIPFQKGRSGNPLGGKLHNPEIKAVKKLTQRELIEVANLVIKGDIGALRKLRADPKTTVIMGMVAGVALKAVVKGDPGAFEALMVRLIGKVPDKTYVSGPGGGPQAVAVMPVNPQERIEFEKALQKAFKKIESDV